MIKACQFYYRNTGCIILEFVSLETQAIRATNSTLRLCFSLAQFFYCFFRNISINYIWPSLEVTNVYKDTCKLTLSPILTLHTSSIDVYTIKSCSTSIWPPNNTAMMKIQKTVYIQGRLYTKIVSRSQYKTCVHCFVLFILNRFLIDV